MNETILYPELLDYIFNYSSRFYTDQESKACWHQFAMDKSKQGQHESFYNHFRQRGHISEDAEVLALLKDGFKAFRIKTAIRIYQEHSAELNLNLCPKCSKIARTPQAKQCRFCLHSWREEMDSTSD